MIRWGSKPSRKGDGSLSEVSKPSGSAKVMPEQEAAGPNLDPVPCAYQGPAAPWHFCWQGRGLS